MAHAAPIAGRASIDALRRLSTLTLIIFAALCLLALLMQAGVVHRQAHWAGPFLTEAPGSPVVVLTVGQSRPLLGLTDTGGDDLENPSRSNIAVTVAGERWEVGHTPHAELRAGKTHAFSHWGDQLYLVVPSELENGPQLVITADYTLQPRPWVMRSLLLAVALLGAAALSSVAGSRQAASLARLFPSSLLGSFERGMLRWDGAPIVAAMFGVVLLTRWPTWVLTGTHGSNADFWRWAVVATALLGGLIISSEEAPRAWRYLVRTLGTVLAVYGIASVQPFALDLHAATAAGSAYLKVLPVAGVFCAIIGWWWPSLYVLPVVALSWYREEFSRAVGFGTSNGEELTLQECVLFLLAGGIVVAIWKRLRPSQSAGIATAFSTLVMAACAIHFGNYYFSAVAKLRLDGGPLDWILTNKTYFLMPAADGIGTLPLSDYGLAEPAYRFFRAHILLFNLVTLGIQLAAVIAIPFVATARIMLLIYDGMHASIAALTGIFFYMWMSLNIAFTAALGFVSVRFTWPARLMFIGLTLLSTRAFTIFEAGWYDTSAYNRVSIEAVMDDGRSVRVSPRIFGILSYWFYSDYSLEQGWKARNALPVSFYGTAYTSSVRKTAEACQLPSGHGEPLALRPFIGPTLRKLQPGVADRTRLWYSPLPFPPQHFLESREPFDDARTINPTAIVAYRFRWEARCVVDTAEGYAFRILGSSDETVPVK